MDIAYIEEAAKEYARQYDDFKDFNSIIELQDCAAVDFIAGVRWALFALEQIENSQKDSKELN